MHEQEVVGTAGAGEPVAAVFDVIIIIVIRHGKRLYREIKKK